MAKLPSGYRITNGKVVKIKRRQSVSQKIAEKKRPKRKFVRASDQGAP